MSDLAQMTGLQKLQHYMQHQEGAGGMVHLVGLQMVSVAFGRVRFTATPSAAYTNPQGTIHGGYLTTLLDSALGCAADSAMPAGRQCTTLELKVSFVQPCRPDQGALSVQGDVVRQGRRVVFTEARIVDDAERLLATASSTLLVLGD
jgi:uncharacterized protein (TIGR00369 family)